MTRTKSAPVAGMLNNNVMRKPGQVGIGAFVDRVPFARNAGIELVDIIQNNRNSDSLSRNGVLTCRFLEGDAIVEKPVQINDIKTFPSCIAGASSLAICSRITSGGKADPSFVATDFDSAHGDFRPGLS